MRRVEGGAVGCNVRDAAQGDNLKRTWLQNVTHYYFYGLPPSPFPLRSNAAPSRVGRFGRTALRAPRQGLSPYVYGTCKHLQATYKHLQVAGSQCAAVFACVR